MQSRVMEKSKVLYNLDEILQNGYSIKTKIPEVTRCKYCNKVLKPIGVLNPISTTINVLIENGGMDTAEYQLIIKSYIDSIRTCGAITSLLGGLGTLFILYTLYNNTNEPVVLVKIQFPNKVNCFMQKNTL